MRRFNKGDLVVLDSEEYASVIVFWRDRERDDPDKTTIFKTLTLNPGTPETIVTYVCGGDHISDVMFGNGRIGWLITKALRPLEE